MCEVREDCIYVYMLQDKSTQILVGSLEIGPQSR